MCRGCDVESGPGWGELWATSSPDERAFDKQCQETLLGRIFSAYGLRCRELAGGDSFVLADRMGRSVIVHGVRHLWGEAARLSGTRIDVLDPGVLDRLEDAR